MAYRAAFQPLLPTKVLLHSQHQPCACSAFPAGIGKALAKRLAGQGLNVVLVALGDDLLDQTTSELAEEYPKVTFKKVGTYSLFFNYGALLRQQQCRLQPVRLVSCLCGQGRAGQGF